MLSVMKLNRYVARLLPIAFLVLFVAGCAQWNEPQELDGKISVNAPRPLESQQLGPNTITYSTSDGRYTALLTEQGERPAEESLFIVKTQTIRNALGREVHSADTEFEGHPALRYGLQTKERGETIDVEVFTIVLKDGTVAQLATNNGNHERYFGSLKLLD